MSNILYVGNSADVARLYKRIIGKAGYNVSYIIDADDEINMCPDILIFDNDMPPALGFAKYGKIIEKFKGAKILWISGNENDEIPALESGADEWIKKPVKLDVLIVRICKLQKQLRDMKENF